MADMERDQAIARLREHEAELKKLGVESLYLFGSTARDEAGPDSDIDLFFDYQEGKFGLFDRWMSRNTRHRFSVLRPMS